MVLTFEKRIPLGDLCGRAINCQEEARLRRTLSSNLISPVQKHIPLFKRDSISSTFSSAITAQLY